MPTASYLILDGEVLAETRGGADRDYLPDPIGSVVALLDSNQARTDEFAYWPYGEERVRTGTTPTPFRFVGTLGYRRDDAARTYVRARVLRPGLALWQTVDPLWPREKAYTYVDGGPTVWTDSSGMAGCSRECDRYRTEPGWYDNNPGLMSTIGGAKSQCSSYRGDIVGALLYCIVSRETRGGKNPGLPLSNLHPGGPCQIWPDKYKDETCKGLDYRRNLKDHLKCCARILCECLDYSKRDILRRGNNSNCATILKGKGGGSRQGTWQVINEDKEGFDPYFKCCLIGHGVSKPPRIIPRS